MSALPVDRMYGAVGNWVGGVKRLDGSERKSVLMVPPEDLMDVVAVEKFRDEVAKIIDGGGHVRFPEVPAASAGNLGSRDYLLLFQACFRKSVFDGVGDNPTVSKLRKFPMYVFTGPAMGRNYYYRLDTFGHVRLNYDEGVVSSWAVIMGLMGIKFGTQDELRAIRACAAGPLVAPVGYIPLVDDVVMADAYRGLDHSLNYMQGTECGCLAGWLYRYVDPRVLTGARTLRDVVNNPLFLHLCGDTGNLSCDGKLGETYAPIGLLDEGTLCSEQHFEFKRIPSDGTSYGVLRNWVFDLASRFLDSPIWCGACAVYDAVTVSTEGTLRCYDCGEVYCSEPTMDMFYRDMLLDDESHYLLDKLVNDGRAVHEADMTDLVARVSEHKHPSEIVKLRPGILKLMTVAGKADYCNTVMCGFLPDDRIWTDLAFANWFDYSYTTNVAFRLAYLLYHWELHGMDTRQGYNQMLRKYRGYGHVACKYRCDLRFDYLDSGTYPKGGAVASKTRVVAMFRMQGCWEHYAYSLGSSRVVDDNVGYGLNHASGCRCRGCIGKHGTLADGVESVDVSKLLAVMSGVFDVGGLPHNSQGDRYRPVLSGPYPTRRELLAAFCGVDKGG